MTLKKKAAKVITSTAKQLKGNLRSSAYIDELRREYSLYVMKSRSIVAESDGLKSAGRRLLWIARDGSTYKCMNLAASTAPLHPHSTPEGSINTLAAQFINNIPLLEGIQSFGTLVDPHAFSASRYTDVKLSKFTKEIMFADSEIIPMADNYDQTLLEPFHFLPLVPVALLNYSEGIAVGFSSNILPRSLGDVLDRQIAYLQGKKIKPVLPCAEPINNCSTGQDDDGRWLFTGVFSRTAHNEVTVTTLPYGYEHAAFMKHLYKLKENGIIVNFNDDSKTSIIVTVIFKKGELRGINDDALIKMLKLSTRHAERLIMVSFKGDTVVDRTFEDAVKAFCDWRLEWFVTRYQYWKLRYEEDLQYAVDYLLTVDSGLAAKFTLEHSKDALEATLRGIGVVNDEKIARLPAYSFTKAEYDKIVAKKKLLLTQIQECVSFLGSEKLRRDQYITELQTIQKNHKQGKYITQI